MSIFVNLIFVVKQLAVTVKVNEKLLSILILMPSTKRISQKYL